MLNNCICIIGFVTQKIFRLFLQSRNQRNFHCAICLYARNYQNPKWHSAHVDSQMNLCCETAFRTVHRLVSPCRTGCMGMCLTACRINDQPRQIGFTYQNPKYFCPNAFLIHSLDTAPSYPATKPAKWCSRKTVRLHNGLFNTATGAIYRSKVDNWAINVLVLNFNDPANTLSEDYNQ